MIRYARMVKLIIAEAKPPNRGPLGHIATALHSLAAAQLFLSQLQQNKPISDSS